MQLPRALRQSCRDCCAAPACCCIFSAQNCIRLSPCASLHIVSIGTIAQSAVLDFCPHGYCLIILNSTCILSIYCLNPDPKPYLSWLCPPAQAVTILNSTCILVTGQPVPLLSHCISTSLLSSLHQRVHGIASADTMICFHSRTASPSPDARRSTERGKQRRSEAPMEARQAAYQQQVCSQLMHACTQDVRFADIQYALLKQNPVQHEVL